MFTIIKAFIITTLLTGAVNSASFSGEVNDKSVDLLINQLMLDDSITPINEPLEILMNSGGGSVLAGFRLINKIRSLQVSGRKIHITVSVLCASMCFTILQSADKRFAYPLGVLMQHGVSGGNQRAIESMERQMRLLESRKIGMSLEVWTRMSEGESWFTPEESVRLGIIDKISVEKHIQLPLEPNETEEPTTDEEY